VYVKAKAFVLDYLAKIAEVKDTVHKHSLLHHLTNMILDQFPDASDLYTDIGAISRCAKVSDSCCVGSVPLMTPTVAIWIQLPSILPSCV